MKCKLKHNDIFGLPDNRQVLITAGEMKRNFEREFNDRSDELFSAIKRDVVAQMMATVLVTINQDYGFGKKRLQDFKRNVEARFIAMAGDGIMGRQLTTQNCIDLMREKYGIDVDARE